MPNNNSKPISVAIWNNNCSLTNMADKPAHDSKKATLEDLLKLKRMERPDATFWERFEGELQQKTLRSIVHKNVAQPSFRLLFGRLHVALPLVGAVAFALTFLVTNGYLQVPDFSSSEVTQVAMGEPVGPVAAENAQGGDFATISAGSLQPSFVVSTLSSETASPRSAYTRVAASKSITSVYRPDVEYVSGGVASSLGSVGTAGIY